MFQALDWTVGRSHFDSYCGFGLERSCVQGKPRLIEKVRRLKKDNIELTFLFVSQITRFAEEIFATLCAGIYVYNALANMAQIGKEHHVAHNHNLTQMVLLTDWSYLKKKTKILQSMKSKPFGRSMRSSTMYGKKTMSP